VVVAVLAVLAAGTQPGHAESTPRRRLTRATPVPTPPARPVIYATFVSHNDESRSNAPCRAMLQDGRYSANRAAIVAMAETIVSHNAAWDFQSDWEYLLTVSGSDTDEERTTTGGKNIVEWLAERDPGRIAVDAHSHEASGYNYADVAQLLADLGVPTTGIVGGFLWTPIEAQNWTRFQSAPLTGLRPPFPRWSPIALWGGGSRNHTDDAQASGVWRPRDAASFFIDDPAQVLFNIGNWKGGVADASGLVDLLDRLHSGQLESGRLYTAHVFLTQCTLDLPGDPSEPAAVAALIDRFAPDVASGDLVWATLPTIAAVWQTIYRREPTMLRDE